MKKNPNSKAEIRKARSRHYRQLYREYQDLLKQQKNQPVVPLKEPFIRGFERYFALSKEALERPDVENLTIILPYFQNHQYCRKGIFRVGKPKGRQWTKGEVGPHQLRRPLLGDLVKGSFPRSLYSYLKPHYFFRPTQNPMKPKPKRGHFLHKIKFRYPQLFESITQKYLVTHIRLIDPKVESRLTELEKILWGEQHRGQVTKALHWRSYRWWDTPHITIKSSLDDFRQQLDEANHDPQIPSAVSPRFFSAPPLKISKPQIVFSEIDVINTPHAITHSLPTPPPPRTQQNEKRRPPHSSRRFIRQESHRHLRSRRHGSLETPNQRPQSRQQPHRTPRYPIPPQRKYPVP